MKKRGFVGKVVKVVFLVMGISILSAQRSTLDTPKMSITLDSIISSNNITIITVKPSSLQMKFLVGKILNERKKELELIKSNNTDTLKYLNRVANKKQKSQKEIGQIVAYKVIPIMIDSTDFETFKMSYPNDTIPAQINIEKIPQKRNIFNKIKGIFKRKNKN